EIFLRQHVGGDLRPGGRHLDIVGMEHHRAVRVADLARGQAELDLRIRRLTLFGVAPLNSHLSAPSSFLARRGPPPGSLTRRCCIRDVGLSRLRPPIAPISFDASWYSAIGWPRERSRSSHGRAGRSPGVLCARQHTTNAPPNRIYPRPPPI